jgi:hypothetical protein
LESLLLEAKRLEKKCEWLQVAENYEQVTKLALKKNNYLTAVELHEKIGFCYCKAALQIPTNIVFKNT